MYLYLRCVRISGESESTERDARRGGFGFPFKTEDAVIDGVKRFLKRSSTDVSKAKFTVRGARDRDANR